MDCLRHQITGPDTIAITPEVQSSIGAGVTNPVWEQARNQISASLLQDRIQPVMDAGLEWIL